MKKQTTPVPAEIQALSGLDTTSPGAEFTAEDAMRRIISMRTGGAVTAVDLNRIRQIVHGDAWAHIQADSDPEKSVYKTNLIYTEKSGRLWKADLDVCFTSTLDVRISPFTEMKLRLYDTFHCIPLNTYEEISEIAYAKYPEAAEHVHNVTCGWIRGRIGFSTDQAGVHKNTTGYMTKYLTRGFLNVLLRPEIAILDKEGYSFFRAFVYGFRGSGSRSTITRCNLLIGQGNTVDEILKVSKPVYSVLEKCCDSEVWDIFRKMEKHGLLNGKEDVELIYTMCVDPAQMNLVYRILGRQAITLDELKTYVACGNTVSRRNNILKMIDRYLKKCRNCDLVPRFGCWTGDDEDPGTLMFETFLDHGYGSRHNWTDYGPETIDMYIGECQKLHKVPCFAPTLESPTLCS